MGKSFIKLRQNYNDFLNLARLFRIILNKISIHLLNFQEKISPIIETLIYP